MICILGSLQFVILLLYLGGFLRILGWQSPLPTPISPSLWYTSLYISSHRSSFSETIIVGQGFLYRMIDSSEFWWWIWGSYGTSSLLCHHTLYPPSTVIEAIVVLVREPDFLSPYLYKSIYFSIRSIFNYIVDLDDLGAVVIYDALVAAEKDLESYREWE